MSETDDIIAPVGAYVHHRADRTPAILLEPIRAGMEPTAQVRLSLGAGDTATSTLAQPSVQVALWPVCVTSVWLEAQEEVGS